MADEIYRKLNWGILIPVLSLVFIGIISIWSVTPSSDVSVFQTGYSLKDKILILLTFAPVKQMLFAILGILIMAGLVFMSYYKFKDYAFLFYLTIMILLVILLVWGRVTHGVKRWIPLGSFAFQPSEFMKIALVLVLAVLLMYHREGLRWRHIIMTGLVSLFPVTLVILQPNLGTSLVFLPTILAMMIVAGLRWRDFIIIILGMLVILPIGYFGVLKDYQKKRLLVFIDPSRAPSAEGFQAIQAKTAVGSGGLFGRGWGESEMTTSSLFVPAKHNDFIFTIIAEEWGFLGSSFIIILYLTFFITALGVAYHTRESFGRLVIVGLVTYLTSQTLLNLGMTIGLAPIAGVTLPFMSYGGSSLLSSFIAVGFILSISLNPIRTFEAEGY